MTLAHHPELSPTDLAFVQQLVRRRSAMILADSKSYLVESRLRAVAETEGLPSVADLVDQLRRAPLGRLHEAVVDAMTINETSFFRDSRPFDALAHTVIPELMRLRADQRTLTFWSAACSSGQEPYSLAMMLRERFPALASWNVRIIASDLSAAMLARAIAGTYTGAETDRGLPSASRNRWFEPRGGSWQVCDDIRSMVEFRIVNLIEPWPFIPDVDLLLLRNVLIYFDVETKQQVLRRARGVLRPGGLLLLGGSETTYGIDPAWDRAMYGDTSFYRPI